MKKLKNYRNFISRLVYSIDLIEIFIFSFTIINDCVSQKGATSVSFVNKKESIINNTFAVIVGISDYQSPEIPDLKFADKDAIAFAEWLYSPAGGSIDSANIQLLINQNATQGKFGAALDWLKESSKEGDKAIIYFSGHGDIEVKTRSQPGFLLCWDAPPKVYTAGGAFGLFYLQDIISTISIDKKAQVLVITDACHSGKLAGSGIGGSQATSAALKQQYANEVKILSCQPNEYALEGIQWGGGRGVFSYYLIDGIKGLADLNKDRYISLSEIENYLEKNVVSDTKPQTQTPITVGERHTTIAKIDSITLLNLIQSKNEGLNNDFIAFRGPVDDYLNHTDTAIKRIYLKFDTAIRNGNLLKSLDRENSADDLFKQMQNMDPESPLVNIMRRNLAAALQDEVQQALNAVLDDNPYEVNNWRYNGDKYKFFPKYLERVVELLGTKHYLYKSLIAKKLFFEAYNMVHYSAARYVTYSDSLKQEARIKLHNALSYDKTAFIYYLLGNSFIYDTINDSIEIYFVKAMELAPSWKLPYAEISWHYLDMLSQYDKANSWLLKGLAIDSNSYHLLEMYAWLQQRMNNKFLVEEICSRMRKLHPELINDYITLAYTYSHVERNFKLAEMNIQKAMSMSNSFIKDTDWVLAYIYLNTRRVEEAKQIWNLINRNIYSGMIGVLYSGMIWILGENKDMLIELDNHFKKPNASNIYQGGYYDLIVYRGLVNILLQRYDSAQYLLEHASKIKYNSSHLPHVRGLSYLGLLYSKQNRIKEAEKSFKRAMEEYPALNNYQSKPFFSEAYYLYGNFLSEQDRLEEAEKQYQSINKKDYGCVLGFYGMATLRARQGKVEEALDWLEKALDWSFPRPEPIYEEPVFKNIRKTKRFKSLMEKNFGKSRGNSQEPE